MRNPTKNQYIPDYITTPGEVISDYLESVDMSPDQLAKATGISSRYIYCVIRGIEPITELFAIQMENIFGRPVHFWLNLERQYQNDLARLRN